jgi:hypothetical protein
MTTVARQATRTIAIHTTTLGDLVISGFNYCELCGRAAHYLFVRGDDDGDEVTACERCVDEHNLGYCAN